MADYTVWDINGLLPGEPWTSAKAISAFENLNAVAEGAPDAPRVMGIAQSGVYFGSLSATGGTPVVFTGLNGARVVEVIVEMLTNNSTGTHPIQISLSANGGVDWGAYFTVASVGIVASASAETVLARAVLDLDASNVFCMATALSGISVTQVVGSFSEVANANAIRVRSGFGGGTEGITINARIMIVEGYV